jgi:hypothetical protein
MKKFYSILGAFVLLFLTQNALATDYYLKSGNGAITTAGNWGPNTDGSGTAPTNFSGSHVWHLTNRTSGSLSFVSWNVATTGTVIIESGFNLTVSSSGGISACQIDIASSGTLTISKLSNYHFGTLDPSSTVVYNTTAYDVRSSSNFANPIVYGNITIAASTSVQGTGVDINIAGVLTLNASRTLTLNTNFLQLQGTSASIAGTGLIYGDNSAGIVLQGGNGGNNGTLNFATGGNILNRLVVSYNSGADFITLGSDLSIEGAGFFAQFVGGLDLNGNDLTIDASSDASFPSASTDGVIYGDASSTLMYGGTLGGGTGNSTMFIDGTDNTLRSLVLNSSGASLGIGNALNITDSLSVLDGDVNSGGNITIKSTNALKGRVSRMGAGATITGDVTVETHVSGNGGGNGTTGWMTMGVNGVQGATVGQWDTWYSSGGATGIPMMCTNCSYPPTQFGGWFNSIQKWNTATSDYDTTVASGDALTLGDGYWVYVGTSTSTTSAVTLVNTGNYNSIVTNPPAMMLLASGTGTDAGYNLVANPYSSPISWTKLFALNSGEGIGGDISVFSPESGGQFGVYTQGAGSGTNGQDDIIPAGQGFFVFTASLTTLDFDESVKMDDNTTNLLKTTQSGRAGEFKLKVAGYWGDNDETMFRFFNGASQYYDIEHDAKKIFKTAGYSGYPGAYTKYTTISSKDSKGIDYAVNSMPALTKNSSVPLLVRVQWAGTYTITASDIDDEATCIILFDKVTGKYTDLKKSSYSFSISDTTSTPRFELSFCQTESGPVGVEEVLANTSIGITQDNQGAIVTTSFETSTKAVISAYNIVGQKLMEDITVEGTETSTRLNLPVHDQIVIIRVRTNEQVVSKKIVAH